MVAATEDSSASVGWACRATTRIWLVALVAPGVVTWLWGSMLDGPALPAGEDVVRGLLFGLVLGSILAPATYLAVRGAPSRNAALCRACLPFVMPVIAAVALVVAFPDPLFAIVATVLATVVVVLGLAVTLPIIACSYRSSATG